MKDITISSTIGRPWVVRVGTDNGRARKSTGEPGVTGQAAQVLVYFGTDVA